MKTIGIFTDYTVTLRTGRLAYSKEHEISWCLGNSGVINHTFKPLLCCRCNVAK